MNIIFGGFYMSEASIYSDIAVRTGGDIYIGVVGPVRTGKSTFIKKFLETAVLPNIENEYDRQRTEDECPQSAGGKTIMTTEPKFIPDGAVKITLPQNTEFNVKMIDCVGYMVDGALGGEENGERRMVMTPWRDSEMPFEEAAELGTKKVISEHSTIGILVTTDGSFTELARDSYIPAEERVVAELKALGKPFAIVLNSKYPSSEGAMSLAAMLEEKYGAPVALVSCIDLDADDIREILGLILGEFPVRELRFSYPAWCEVLEREHPIRRGMLDKINGFCDKVSKLGDIERCIGDFEGIVQTATDASRGCAKFDIPIGTEEFYSTLRELTKLEIYDEKSLLQTLTRLAVIEEKYKKISDALSDVEDKGYGIVMPSAEELRLEEPKLVKSAGGWGVKVSASADSIHMIKSGIRADLCPVVGTEAQAEEVVRYLAGEYESCPEKIWECNMFGKSLYDLVNDGMQSKLSHMPDESRERLGQTLEKIINEGSNGLICILL